MTKGEIRRARKAARDEGKPLTGALALPSDTGRDPVSFSESFKGEKARERWARSYYERDGAPEGDYDR